MKQKLTGQFWNNYGYYQVRIWNFVKISQLVYVNVCVCAYTFLIKFSYKYD